MTSSVDFVRTPLSRRRLLAATGASASLLAVAPWMTLRSAGAQTSGDEFVVANEAEPTDMLPWFGGYGAGLVTLQVYETLAEPRMTLAADGSVEITLVPVLAESWEQVDETRWRFKWYATQVRTKNRSTALDRPRLFDFIEQRTPTVLPRCS